MLFKEHVFPNLHPPANLRPFLHEEVAVLQQEYLLRHIMLCYI